MNKKLIMIVSATVVAVVIGIAIIKGSVTGQTTHEPITLGYCPTMQPIAERIANENNHITLIGQQSSAQALQALNEHGIDVALIGRKAEEKELQKANERMLGEGYTLVTVTKRFTQENELANVKVHTAIEEYIAKQMLPETEMRFYETTQEAITKGLHEAVLIDWKDYDDEFELLVVLKGMDKSERFRIPVLYSNYVDLETIIV